ncbi:MAG TPA: universal stress protein [Candidatus Saccharimonadales bacterium]|nr:universal stress protein [Candidatus Saccharimonadales bacterium]
MNFKRILVGISTINESKKVVNQSISIAKYCRSELHVITVFDIPDIYSSKINPDKLSHIKIKERVEKMEHRLLEIKKDAEREELSVVTELIDENRRPDKSLLTYCKDKKIDLIVVGKGRGKGEQFKEWILGSTALEIAKYSNCSVMIIK